MVLGIDFGLTVTDAIALVDGSVTAQAALDRPGPASEAVIDQALAALDCDDQRIAAVAVSGGRSRLLPDDHRGVPLIKVPEPTASAAGALALAGSDRALVVSCGTGTAMIDADRTAGSYTHVTGTPMGGGTLEGLGQLLLGLSNGADIAALAEQGSAAGVDTTLGDVLGGALGQLPPTATAVSFGRVTSLRGPPQDEDVAAGLCVMVAQNIAFIALNAAKAVGAEQVVFVGRVARFPPISHMLKAVFAVYHFPTVPLIPEHGEIATALGAALVAGLSLPA